MNEKEEVVRTGRKLKRLIESEERIEARIAQLQEELKSIRESKRKEEELEMVRSIRSLKLGGRDLFDLLEGIRDGSVSLEPQQILDAYRQEEDRDNPISSEETADTGDTENKVNPEQGS